MADYNPSVFGLLLKGVPTPAAEHFVPTNSMQFRGNDAVIGVVPATNAQVCMDVDNGQVTVVEDGETLYANETLAMFYRCATVVAEFADCDCVNMSRLQKRVKSCLLRRRLEEIEPGVTSDFNYWGGVYRAMVRPAYSA